MSQRFGRNEKTSFLIVDAQSVENTDTAASKGVDGANWWMAGLQESRSSNPLHTLLGTRNFSVINQNDAQQSVLLPKESSPIPHKPSFY